MSKGFGANATRLLIAAVTGFRGVQFNFGNLLSRYATPAKASYEERPTSYARKTGLTVAASKRASVKAKNRAKHKLAVRRAA